MSAPASPAGATTRSRRSWRSLGFQLLIASLWVAASQLARIQEYAPQASLWFPPAGLTFAVGLTLGWRGLPGVVLGSLVVTASPLLTTADPWRLEPVARLLGAGLTFGLAHGLAYLSGGAALRRLGGDPRSARAASGLLLVAPASAMLATAAGLAALQLFGEVASWEEIRGILLPFWIGDFVGVVALGPFFTLVLWRLASRAGFSAPDPLRVNDPRPDDPAHRLTWWTKFAACLLPLGVSALLVERWPDQALTTSFFVFFGLVPLTWIAHSEGPARTYIACALLSTAIAGTGALLGEGPHAITYQFAMIILAGSAYFGLAVPLLYADNRDLRRLLTTDPLTGAATRTHFLETAERELARARRFGTDLSLVVFDLDHFKLTNDLHGHAFGDLALATAAARCRSELRAADLLARVGGEEFAVLLPMTSSSEARATSERLAAALRTVPVRRDGVEHTLTASFGVTAIDPLADSIESALVRADRALYEAKRLGRDRVAIAP
jgi:diguanylate cyclase (GGDEF)-like protein